MGNGLSLLVLDSCHVMIIAVDFRPPRPGAFGSRPAMAMPIPHAAGDGINLALVRRLEPPGGRK